MFGRQGSLHFVWIKFTERKVGRKGKGIEGVGRVNPSNSLPSCSVRVKFRKT